MRVIAAIPAVLSLLVLGAHFMRQQEWILVGVCLAMPVLLLIRRVWARRLVQLSLLVGSLVWLWTMVQITEIRAQSGASTTRMMIIMCGVSVFTLISGLLVSFLIRPHPISDA